jgi:hypothetical protein
MSSKKEGTQPQEIKPSSTPSQNTDILKQEATQPQPQENRSIKFASTDRVFLYAPPNKPGSMQYTKDAKQ